MPQQTNLNVSPYFDDFDANNDYHKVLFKPGYPVQARELTTLQSILQNQIEKFGQHFFKEGAKVIPGNTAYNALYYCVQLQNTYLGVPVAAYADQLVGTKITGQTSGISAVVDKVLLPQDSEKGNTTLYINYLNSNTQNNSSQQFSDGESLVCNTTITSGLLGNTSISAGQPLAVTLATNSTATGSSFSISSGVYFIRGQFISVDTETLILDQYNNRPNYRVGLFINEEIINSDIDEALSDNSQGFNNYSAPGADRLKITASLFKKSLDDFDDNNFVELALIRDGDLRSQTQNTEYSQIADELARRTYNESGDYIIKPFDITAKESLNNNLGNQGIFNRNQFTYGGLTPSDNLAVYQISPGKAVVRGYDVETISSTFLDVEKPRTTKTLENQSINYNTGSALVLNNVYGSPVIGIGNTYVLSLRDKRVGSSSAIAPGKEIGVARVYDFNLESGTYDAINPKLNQWEISLYDIQTITEITLNEPITLSVPTFVEGKNSGASGFIKNAVSGSTLITLYDTKGSFLKNESFSFDGIDSGYVAAAVTSYGISDIKSVFNSVSTFSADTIQLVKTNFGVVSISQVSSGISTVTSPNPNFPGSFFRVDNLISYSDTSLSEPVYAKVVSVATTSITISGVSTVSGIANGKLPTSTFTANDFRLLTTNLPSSSDDTLYTRLPKNNISTVDLTNANLTIRKSFTVDITTNRLSTPVSAGTNEIFLPFDEERYSLIRSDGSTEILTSDRFDFIDGGKQLQIVNLGSNNTGATLVATLRKIKPKSKSKRKNRVNTLVVDKSKYQGSGIGATTLNDGLSFGNYAYGTRVQDKNISLNVPDIIEIHGIFESTDTSIPSAPRMILSSISGPSNTTSDLVIGEQIIGQNGNAIGIVVDKISNSEISFTYKNQNSFNDGEPVVFGESNIQAVIASLNSPSFNISFNYTFSAGQRGSFYDYGYITRKPTSEEPSKKIKIYFSSAFYDSADDGDITTVNSYNTFDYTTEIPAINGNRCCDIIDIRPRVSSYTVSENSRSPLEFYGRTFNASGNSSANILASDESILTNYSFYLGRIDRLYLTKDGVFQLKYGTPAERPEKPVSVDDALEIAVIDLPPYLHSASQVSIQSLEHKRYRMVDIRQLENRIKNLEYYTALSLLETNTANLFVPDESGLNRFKSGFFVDNFTNTLSQENRIEIKNSIDATTKELRAKHYTNSIDLIFGPVENTDPTQDLAFSDIEGINVRKTGDVVTLDYAEVEWLTQPFATRTESITPFLVSFWQGTVELTPASDTWVDTVRVDPKVTTIEGNYAQTLSSLNADPQTGFAPTVWGSWEQNWTGKEVVETTKTRTEANYDYDYRYRGYKYNYWNYGWYWGWPYYGYYNGYVENTIKDTYQEVIETGTETRQGNRTIVSEQFDNVSNGDRVVSRDLISYMRSRNIQFIAKRVKPLTQLFAFFDGIDVTKYCVPKLLEISMISGTFEVGETVIGRMGNSDARLVESSLISFRVSQANHREGPYNSPNTTFPENPYTNQVLSATYSSTSSLLNIDTFSLSNESQGLFGGWVETGMRLVGRTSGAQATITNVRLVSDLSATLIGSFYVPNPNSNIHPRFETGVKTLTFVNNNLNDQRNATTIAEENFSSSGTLETIQENITSVRNARLENKQVFEEQSISRSSGSQLVDSKVIDRNYNRYHWYWWKYGYLGCWYDPLAQSILIGEDTGIFVTRCDVFFKTKDTSDIPVTFQLRTMENGYPTQQVIPFSEIVLDPSQVQVSDDGSIATPFVLKTPVYLEGGKEYCICLLSNSTNYNVFISRVGENDILTQAFISNQPYLGSLFKSQNASTWEASQWEDLKFTLYRADFIENGTVEVYNPELAEGNNQIPKLMPDSLNFNSKKVRVSLASTLNDPNLTVGNTILQLGTNATGNYVGNAGIATGSLGVINSGIGYTPTSGSLVFNNVSLETITGYGRGATANITISNGASVAATIVSGGSGYQVGDVLGISSIGTLNVGRNARFSLPSISNINQLVIDGIQGNFLAGVGNTVQYVNNIGVTTNLNGTGVSISEIITENDGLHIKVDHKNHGMYFNENFVSIYGSQPDIKPTKLSVVLSSDSTSSISVDNSSGFSTFENVGVGTTNPGYILIGDEIIEYTSTSSGIIGGDIVRGENPRTYPIGTPVYKYELNGISLKRINKIHNLENATVENPITFDSYHIKIDMTSDGVDRSTDIGFPALYSNQTKSSGGYEIRASQNMPFEIITPLVQNLTVKGTSLSAEVRTITGRSISGNEIPFADSGFEPITVNAPNYLSSTRLIASKVNETDKLSNFAGNKSMNMRLTLETTDSRVSPVIDTQRISTILTSNRVNNVILDYKTDPRVNSLLDDPSAFQYISKEIVLANPASSIKILLSSHINSYSDIRALYSISENPNFDPIFTLFPGYKNINSQGRVIDLESSDGSSDSFISPSNRSGFDSSELEYREYTFSADNLPSFRSYRIKLILTSTNQVYIPRVRDLRVIALA